MKKQLLAELESGNLRNVATVLTTPMAVRLGRIFH